jgi:hypothetical protein
MDGTAEWHFVVDEGCEALEPARPRGWDFCDISSLTNTFSETRTVIAARDRPMLGFRAAGGGRACMK